MPPTEDTNNAYELRYQIRTNLYLLSLSTDMLNWEVELLGRELKAMKVMVELMDKTLELKYKNNKMELEMEDLKKKKSSKDV